MASENYCMIQGFEWNCPADQKHWKRLQSFLPDLKAIGIDNIWIPPACKGDGGASANGYDIYDMWDLGEFEQKGTRSTKWGSKEDLIEFSQKAKELGVGLYFDAVLNHKAGADHKEKCRAQEVNKDNRMEDVGEPFEMEAWLGFCFHGRGEKYSKQKYHWEHFSGTDYNASNGKMGIYRLVGENKKGWSKSVGNAFGNADFLMCADLDYSNHDVAMDVINWTEWVTRELNLKGFRLDACQHFSQNFTRDLIVHLKKQFGEDSLFLMGEYWVPDVDRMVKYVDDMHHHFSLYDSPLVWRFSSISTSINADLRTVFDGTLVQARPNNAVTVVMNHDTQPGATVDTRIEGYFKPLGYCLILLRRDGYPCVFYGDLFGLSGEHKAPPACGGQLADIVLARKLYAYGDQNDYWNEANCIGFVRRGTYDHPNGLACVMSNAGSNQIRMAVGELHKGEVWTDVLGWQKGEVRIEDDGFGVFPCHGVSVSIWVNKAAEGRDRFGGFDDQIYARELA